MDTGCARFHFPLTRRGNPMRRFIASMLATLVISGFGATVRADADKDAMAILDKAIKALGREEKLGSAKVITWKGKGTINIMGNDNRFTGQVTIQGLDHFRNQFESDNFKGAIVVNGDKGWRKFGDMGGELEKDMLANEKRNV